MATLKELKEKVSVRRGSGYNSYIVTITYRGEEYSCHSNNSLAWDRIHDDCVADNVEQGFYTLKGAYQALYNECKRDNGIE